MTASAFLAECDRLRRVYQGSRGGERRRAWRRYRDFVAAQMREARAG